MEEEQRSRNKRKKQFSFKEVARLIAEIDSLKPRFRLLTRIQAADYLGAVGATNYTSKALANLASRGMGPPYLKLGNVAYYLEHDLDSWLLKNRIVPSDFFHKKEA